MAGFYTLTLNLHSWNRWAVLISLICIATISLYRWKKQLPFTKAYRIGQIITVSIAHLQLIIGLYLYFISPISNYFLSHFSESIHDRELRFFGMEHIFVMLIAIGVITVGNSKVKKAETDEQKFKLLFIWFGIGLVLILSSIPWSFSPLISRPLFRSFIF